MTGWTLESVRALVYVANNYTWADEDAIIVVKIQNYTIDRELGHSSALRLLAMRPTILALHEAMYITQHGQPPPLALPKAP